MRFYLLSLLVLLAVPTALSAQSMTIGHLDSLLRAHATDVEGRPGFWEFSLGERPVLVITDEGANRMRVFSPIVRDTDLDEEGLRRMLEANFHSALDAKYCLHQGFVISVFTHPLRELTDAQFIDALFQVVTLAETYGSTYQSTDLIFGGEPGQDEQLEEEQPREEEKRVRRS